jgi:hypothetical protein
MPRSTSHARKAATDSPVAGSAITPRLAHQASKPAKSLLYARLVALAFSCRARSAALSRSGASNAGTADEATGTSAFASCGVTQNSLGLVPRITVIGTKTLLY